MYSKIGEYVVLLLLHLARFCLSILMIKYVWESLAVPLYGFGSMSFFKIFVARVILSTFLIHHHIYTITEIMQKGDGDKKLDKLEKNLLIIFSYLIIFIALFVIVNILSIFIP